MYLAAVFMPLLGAIVAGFLGKRIGDRMSQYAAIAGVLIPALLSPFILWEVGVNGNATSVTVLRWITVGGLEIDWALQYDTLSAVMVFVVTVVSSMVHIYSVGYMHHDKAIPRFFAYLSLFTFFMLMLVTSDNFVQMFFGWEGVGLASYLLIGFWYDRPSANAAAIKAFLVNRVGDFGFGLGICGVFLLYEAVAFTDVFAATPRFAETSMTFLGLEFHALTVLCLLLFMGAMGKSAQLGLHTWLPDAMEGPTPVSALIHAATMVTAGVFMVARLSPMFEYSETALAVVTLVGAATAFFAATVGLTQNDIKRVIAYSTCSQLGYMFFAAGVGAYGAAIFHLATHAFFKALLFLGAGSVIHAMSDEQDMRKMGGIWRQIPITYAMMWIGSLALAGVGIPFLKIGFAGFYSKDMILESAFAAHSTVGAIAFWLGILAALMTAFYSWRLLFMTFHGAPRADEKVMAHVHESPWVMLGPLVVLAIGAVFSGAVGYKFFVGSGHEAFWGESILVLGTNVMEEAHHVPAWVVLAPLAVTAIGIWLAWLFYIASPGLPGATAEALRPLYRFSFNKWYFDELYDAVFVRPAMALGRMFWRGGDMGAIDRFGPNGLAYAARRIAEKASKLQTGYLYHYAFAMMMGIFIMATWHVLGF